MKSQELSEEVKAIVEVCQSRIMGIGAQQYAENDQQKFETMDLDALLVYMKEELYDQVNYSCMNLIRIERIQGALIHARRLATAETYAALSQGFIGEPKSKTKAKSLSEEERGE